MASGHKEQLRRRLADLSRRWRAKGLVGREELVNIAHALMQWRQRHGNTGLWDRPPLLITATLDDAIGQGIEIIQLFAKAMGLAVIPLGVRQTPNAITAACRRHRPAFLGLTVLWMDAEDDLALVARRLPPGTRLIAGGPAFKYDPEMASRCGVHCMALNVAFFIDYVLQTCPTETHCTATFSSPYPLSK